MGTQNWIVKNAGGREWGLIKRLVIDSGTRQINFADVVVIHSGDLIRIPWDSFEVQREGIRLRMTESQVVGSDVRVGDDMHGGVVSMDVWP